MLQPPNTIQSRHYCIQSNIRVEWRLTVRAQPHADSAIQDSAAASAKCSTVGSAQAAGDCNARQSTKHTMATETADCREHWSGPTCWRASSAFCSAPLACSATTTASSRTCSCCLRASTCADRPGGICTYLDLTSAQASASLVGLQTLLSSVIQKILAPRPAISPPCLHMLLQPATAARLRAATGNL